jgi:hypothetical protein
MKMNPAYIRKTDDPDGSMVSKNWSRVKCRQHFVVERQNILMESANIMEEMISSKEILLEIIFENEDSCYLTMSNN